MIQKIKNFIQEFHMIEKGDRVVIGVSGGADSMCLLFVLCELRKEIPMYLSVVHVEHGIRGETSKADARYVREVCERLHVSFHEAAIDCRALAREWNMTVEEAGRTARYEAFERECPDKIAVAHHQNDVAETLLFHLCRGTGLKGLGGIPPVRGKIIRPLLCVTAEEIRAYLKKNHMEWREDETNGSEDYTRNRIRSRMIPEAQKVNEKAVSHMAEAALRMREIEAYMTEVAEAAYERYLIETENDRKVILDIRLFTEEKPIIAAYVLQRVFCEMAGKWKDIAAVNLKDIADLATKQSGRRVLLPYGMAAFRIYNTIVIRKEFEIIHAGGMTPLMIPKEGEMPLPDGRVLKTSFLAPKEVEEMKKKGNIPNETYTKWLDYDKINTSVVLRTRQAGDYFYVNSGLKSKKLKSFFIDEKIPIDERNRIFLLADGNHILWILGYRISEKCKITELTERIWKVSVTKEKGYGK